VSVTVAPWWKRLAPKETFMRVLLGIVLGLLAMAEGLRADEAEDRAVRAIERLGGRVMREKAAGSPVFGISLNQSKATDADLKELSGFTHLRYLDLGYTQVTEITACRSGVGRPPDPAVRTAPGGSVRCVCQGMASHPFGPQ
jgi:hypothetical protein